MALKLKITADEHGKLPEGIKELYTAKDDGFVLSVEGIEDTSGLKSALEKERKARADFEKLSKSFQGLGKSPEEIAELVKAQEEAEKSKLEQKGEWEKLKIQLLETHQKELLAEQAKVNAMKTTLESYLVDAQATEAIAGAEGSPLLLLPHVKNSVKVIEENGKFIVRVLGPDGVARMNSKGEYLGIKDVVAEMKLSDAFAPAFKGTGVSGGGSPSGTPIKSGGGSFTISREDAQDPMKYRAVKEAAAKAGQQVQIAPQQSV